MDKKTIWMVIIVIITIVFITLYIDEALGTNIEEIDLEGNNGKTIFVISGITGTPLPYEEFAQHFNELGYNIKVPILKNHGGKLSAIKDTSINEIKMQLKEQIEEISGEVIIMGTCSGALLTLDLSNDLNTKAILINPPLKPIKAWKYLSFIPYIYRFDMGLVKDKDALEKVPRYNKYPIPLLIGIHEYVQTLNLESENEILIFHSVGDIRAQGGDTLHSKASNSILVNLNNSGHLAFIDVEKDIVFDKIEKFIR